ncbi:hypothetical protein [Streptacidiphilus sp. MAP5-3]|jgi:hypothetical protein
MSMLPVDHELHVGHRHVPFGHEQAALCSVARTGTFVRVEVG